MKKLSIQNLTNTLLAGIISFGSLSTIAQKYDLVTLVQFTEPSCSYENDGSILVSPSGGTPPYSIVWSTGDTTASIQDLTAGTYFVTIQDNAGFEITSEVELSAPDQLYIEGIITHASLFGALNGAIDVNLSGGDGNYSFTWSTSNGSGLQPLQLDQTNISNGLYHIDVMDGQDCRASEDFQLIAQFVPVSGHLSNGFVVSDGTTELGNVYPNPSNGKVNIKMEVETARVEVYNSMGVLMKRLIGNDGKNLSEELKLNPGNYSVVFIHIDGTSVSEMLIVR